MPSACSRFLSLYEWLLTEEAGPLFQQFGVQFTVNYLKTLCAYRDVPGSRLGVVAFIELAVLLGVEAPPWLPVPSDCHKGQWVEGSRATSGATLASLQRLVRAFFLALQRAGFDFAWQAGLNLVSARIYIPQAGIILRLPLETGGLITGSFARLTRRRPIRAVNDLSRPLRLIKG